MNQDFLINKVNIMKFSYILLGLLSTTVYAADLYTWTDEDGNVQYSQTSPAQEIDATVKTLPTLPIVEETKKSPAPEEKMELKETATTELQDENCKKAHDNLQMLNMNAGELVIRNSDNPDDFVKLSEEERQQEYDRTQTYIDTYCQE